jgi:hypothetical protein
MVVGFLRIICTKIRSIFNCLIMLRQHVIREFVNREKKHLKLRQFLYFSDFFKMVDLSSYTLAS